MGVPQYSSGPPPAPLAARRGYPAPRPDDTIFYHEGSIWLLQGGDRVVLMLDWSNCRSLQAGTLSEHPRSIAEGHKLPLRKVSCHRLGERT